MARRILDTAAMLLARWTLALRLAVAIAYAALGVEAASCGDAAACQERMQAIMGKLQSTDADMRSRKATMSALEGFRTGLMHGERVPLPSAHRQHLERGSPLVSEVSYDDKHRPLSTNVSKHMKHIKTLSHGSDLMLQGILPVKKPAGSQGSTVLIATLEGKSSLSLLTQDGETRLSKFDLGHEVAHMSLSGNSDHSYVLTGDTSGNLHVLTVELVMKNASSSDAKDEDDADAASDKKRPKKVMSVVANTTAKFSLPSAGDDRKITSVLTVDRGSQPFFVAGDSLGSLAVFFKNGTLKGRIKVTEDPGGILGLRRGTGQTVLFFSSHSFGFLSVPTVDVQSPPCTGWNSPAFDVAADPQSTYSRVVLALSDGDVLVYSTSAKSKDKGCDLSLKFPRLSSVPLRLHVARGHVMGLPSPNSDVGNPDLYFFNTAAMETGYGSGHSRIVTLQASFHPRRLDSFSLQNSGGGGSSPKVLLALQFVGQSAGMELYELNLKTPAAPRADSGGGSGSDFASWLDWIPKVGILGVTLIGVVIWNVRKFSGGKQASGGGGGGGGGGLPDFDDDLFKERLRKRKEKLNAEKDEKDGDAKLDDELEALRNKTKKKPADTKPAAPSSAGVGTGGLDLDLDRDLGDLNARTQQMEDLLASMGGDD